MESNDTPAKPVHAVFANGIFRPTEPVSLPENCRVQFVPEVVTAPSPGEEGESHDQSALWEILNRRFSSGQGDLAERHNEHQP